MNSLDRRNQPMAGVYLRCDPLFSLAWTPSNRVTTLIPPYCTQILREIVNQCDAVTSVNPPPALLGELKPGSKPGRIKRSRVRGDRPFCSSSSINTILYVYGQLVDRMGSKSFLLDGGEGRLFTSGVSVYLLKVTSLRTDRIGTQ